MVLLYVLFFSNPDIYIPEMLLLFRVYVLNSVAWKEGSRSKHHGRFSPFCGLFVCFYIPLVFSCARFYFLTLYEVLPVRFFIDCSFLFLFPRPFVLCFIRGRTVTSARWTTLRS